MIRYGLAILLFATTLAAQDLSQFERILLPGWTRERIVGPDGTTFAGGGIAVTPERAKYWPSPDNTIGTLAPYTVFSFPGPSRVGRVLHVERAFADRVSVDLTLFIGVTGESASHFTTVPIVRERDLLTAPSRIMNVFSLYDFEPLQGGAQRAIPRFRHHLRIYDIDGRGDAQVLVRRFDEGAITNFLLTEEVVTLSRREGTDASFPAYAEILLPEICHPFSSHSPCTGGSQYIELEPLTNGLRYWAMVTATNNATREVTIKWPQ